MATDSGLLALVYNIGMAVGSFLERYGHNPAEIRINPKTLETWGENKVKTHLGGIPIIKDGSIKQDEIQVQ